MKAVLFSEENKAIRAQIAVTGSKSESNRLLILQALYPNLTIENLSKSDDTQVLSEGLTATEGTVDIHHAGTAMRFLTAYFASRDDGEILLTGSPRMQQRPIAILVDALRSLGAQIEYESEEGFPPLRIFGKKLTKTTVSLAAHVSSQYISALMLIAPSLPNGLILHLDGIITSVPYITMTLSLLDQLGIKGSFQNNTITIPAFTKIKNTRITVESDWSSASYFYSIVALSTNTSVHLTSYRKQSLQGDAHLAHLYESLGVKTEFLPSENAILLSKTDHRLQDTFTFELSNTPDIAQTIAVSCFGLGKGCFLTGLHTLRIKETDRLSALKIELEKLGGSVEITKDSLRLLPAVKISENIEIDTYNDHRMAMAFAPLALRVPITINDCEVVSKSFPGFWEDIANLGISVTTD